MQLFQRVLEAQSQRIAVRGGALRRLDHQPPHQQIEYHMTGHFVTNRFRGAAAQAALQALRHFQFVKRGFDFPAPMVQPDAQTHAAIQRTTRFRFGRHADPVVATDPLRIQHIGHHGTCPEAFELIADHTQVQATPPRTGGSVPTDKPVSRSQPAKGLQLHAGIQPNGEEGPRALNRMEQSVAPKPLIHQHQVVRPQPLQQPPGDRAFAFVDGTQRVAPRQTHQGRASCSRTIRA